MRPEDFPRLAAAGVRSVISNLPDGEAPDAPSSWEAGRAARRAGLAYRHLPAVSHALFDAAMIEGFEQALADLPTPVVAHCRTGTRSAVLWARLAVRQMPVAAVLRHLADAGYDLDYLSAEFAADAGPARVPAAADGFAPGPRADSQDAVPLGCG